jgi:hypothetical protein
MTPTKIGTVTFRKEVLDIFLTKYANNKHPAVIINDNDGQGYATLSVNLPSNLEEGEIHIKTWSENAEIANAVLVQTDLFEDTGKRVPTGHCQAEVWKMRYPGKQLRGSHGVW